MVHATAGSRIGRSLAGLLVIMLGAAVVLIGPAPSASADDQSPPAPICQTADRGSGTEAVGGAEGANEAEAADETGCLEPTESVPAVEPGPQPAAEVHQIDESENLDCETRRSRAGTITTEYIWDAQSATWVLGVPGEPVWGDWVPTPLTEQEKVDAGCSAAPVAPDEPGDPEPVVDPEMLVPVVIDQPAYDLFDADCAAGGSLVVVDSDEYYWVVDGEIAGGRSFGPGVHTVTAIARDGFAFADGAIRYEAGDVYIDGPDPGVCGYPDDDEPTGPTKVLGTSADPASGDGPVELPTEAEPQPEPATDQPGATSTAPARPESDQAPAAVESTGGAGASSAGRDESVAAPVAARSAAPAGSGPASPAPDEPAKAVAAARSADPATSTTHGVDENSVPVPAVESTGAVPAAAGSEPIARSAVTATDSVAPQAVAAPAPVSAQVNSGSNYLPYLLLVAGLFLFLLHRRAHRQR